MFITLFSKFRGCDVRFQVNHIARYWRQYDGITVLVLSDGQRVEVRETVEQIDAKITAALRQF